MIHFLKRRFGSGMILSKSGPGRKLIVMILALCLLTGGASLFPVSAKAAPENRTNANVAVQLSYSTLNMSVGGRILINAAVSGTEQAVTWKSLNAPVATVSASGVVTAVKEGVATILATAGGVTARCSVTVSSSFIRLSKQSVSLWKGYTQTVTASVTGRKGTVLWESLDPSIATVNQSGMIKGVKGGTTTVTASVNGVSASCRVAVYEPSITLSSSSKTMYLSQTVTLRPTIKGKLATVSWKSSNTSVATVTSGGTVKAVKTGSATVTATANGVTARCQIKVVNPTLTLSSTSMELVVAKTKKLTVTVKNGGSEKIVWKSLNSSVATVDQDGVVTGVKTGTATITASAYGKTLKCTVTVVKLSKREKAITAYNKYLTKLEYKTTDPETVTSVGKDKIRNFYLFEAPGYDVPLMIVTTTYKDIMRGEYCSGQRIMCYKPGVSHRGVSDIAVVENAGTAEGVYNYMKSRGFSCEMWYYPYYEVTYVGLKKGSALEDAYVMQVNGAGTYYQHLTAAEYNSWVNAIPVSARAVCTVDSIKYYSAANKVITKNAFYDTSTVNDALRMINYQFPAGYDNIEVYRVQYLK